MKRKNEMGDAIAMVLILIIVAAVVGVGWYVVKQRNNTNKTVASTEQGSTVPAKISAAATAPANTTPLAPSNDTSALNSDLQNLGSSLGQGDSNLQSASASLSDQQGSVTE